MISFLVCLIMWGYGTSYDIALVCLDGIVSKGLISHDDMNSCTFFVVVTLSWSLFGYMIFICYYSYWYDLILIIYMFIWHYWWYWSCFSYGLVLMNIWSMACMHSYLWIKAFQSDLEWLWTKFPFKHYLKYYMCISFHT